MAQTKGILKQLLAEHGQYGLNYLYLPTFDSAFYSSSYEAHALLKMVNENREAYDEVVKMYKRYRDKVHAHEEAKEWKEVDRIHFADNSIEVIYEDKDGNRKQVMETAPHGDACY